MPNLTSASHLSFSLFMHCPSLSFPLFLFFLSLSLLYHLFHSCSLSLSICHIFLFYFCLPLFFSFFPLFRFLFFTFIFIVLFVFFILYFTLSILSPFFIRLSLSFFLSFTLLHSPFLSNAADCVCATGRVLSLERFLPRFRQKHFQYANISVWAFIPFLYMYLT